MKRAVFDIETNELLRKLTRRWITVAYDLDTQELVVWLEDDNSWMAVFDQLDELVGHNILSFDLPALEKLYGYKLPDTVNVFDTLIMSQVLNYRRFGYDGHSLEVWGQHLGSPKHTFSDFSQYSEDMRKYCEQDVLLNVKVYETLMVEFHKLYEKAPAIGHYLRAEHYAAQWCAQAELHGWPFDMNAALELFDKLETDVNDITRKLEAVLGMKAVPLDKKKGIVEEKKPRWTKQGFYDHHTCNSLGLEPVQGLLDDWERPVVGPYCRVAFENMSLSSVADVKAFLFRHGWEPSEWNFKRDEATGKKVKTSPKIVEDDLELLGGDGKLYSEYTVAKSRYNVIKTWIENVDENGNLHGGCMVVGTPSMRARHEIIVNVPRAKSKFGKEMRAMFKCKPGWKLIGCDSAGNQARGLAHYLGDQAYIDILLHGDIHQYNADRLTEVLKSIGVDHVVDREVAKRIFYAVLFGAQGAKMWLYTFGKTDHQKGTKYRNGFLKSVPGFAALIEKLEKIYGSTSKFGEGYIPSLAGNRIYVDSFHKLLVYLLQSAEKITCSSALMFTMKQLKKENIPYQPCIFMHDEIDFMVPEEYAERAAEIGKTSFAEAPKLYGVTIMDGSGKIGNNWLEVH